ncbi:hypothetical protein DB459_13710 [Bradyrhizobium sp. WD16]|nr:hypothetical protein DB459_13710 [Bradyrhizobium sp. WD16]
MVGRMHMSQTHLLLTITEEKMHEAARGAAPVDIESLIENIPSAVIVSGDRALSVHVEVDSRHADEVIQSVKGICTVDRWREMKLLNASQRSRSTR